MKAHKNSWYKEWHQWNLNHHFHVAMLVFYILSIFLGSIGFFLPNNGALAASKNWAFNEGVPSDYYSYGTDILVNNGASGVAELGHHTPNTDWIATDVNNWFNRRTITITNPNNSSAFQVKISSLDTQQGGKMHYDGTDCEDLRFTSSDGVTVISHWVESASCNSASTDVWVKVPQSVSTIYMYYNNSNEALTSTSSDTAVFERVIGNVQGAWQFNNLLDSSGNNNSGAITGSLSQASDRNGLSNHTYDFPGNSSDYITVNDHASLDIPDDFTLSAWIQMDNGTRNDTHRSIFNKGDNTNVNYRMRVNSTGPIQFSWVHGDAVWHSYSGTTDLDAAPYYNPNWTHIAVAYDKDDTGNEIRFYLNGVANGTASDANNPSTNSGPLYIGLWPGFASYFDGRLDDLRIYNDVLTSTEIQNIATSGNISYFSPTLHANTEYVQKYTANVSAGAAGSEDGYYHNNYPTIQNVESGNGQSYSYISAMNITTSGTGSARFQISPDNGTTWYRWNGSEWVSIASPDTYDPNKTNASSDVTTNISSFRPGGANPRNFRWRAFFVSDGIQTVTLDDVSITYVTDTAAPDNPVIGGVTCYQSDGGSTFAYDPAQLWHNYSVPKFAWTPPSDNNNGGAEENSGVWRYYAKLTTDAGYTPTSADFTTNNYLVAAGLTNGQTYYLRVRTVDNAENVSAASTLLTYKYDNVSPTDPANLQVNTLQPTDQPLSFSWEASADVGTPGEMSEFDHYSYKVGSITGWQNTSNTSVSGIVGDEDGNNTFRVKAVDKAGNESAEETIVYNYILNAPSEPLNLVVTDQSKNVNDFEFTWEAPSYVEPGNSIAGYKFFVNELPTAFPVNDYSYMGAGSNDLGNVLTKSGIRATRQGVNRLYLVAYDDDSPSKVNYSKYAWKDFQVDTTATALTAPRNVAISDVSDRNTPEHFAIALSWKNPANYSAGTFGHYNIRRATSLVGLDLDSEWLALTPVGTSTSNAFAESLAVGNVMYYYRVSGVDNAGAEVYLSDVVSKVPTGKYIVAPGVNSGPSVITTATTAVVNWVTDRACYSKVEYGKAPNSEMQNSSLQGVTAHTLTLYGLEPGTTYYYRVQSLDSGDQKDYNNNLAYTPLSGYSTFQTQPAPGISDVKISDIRLDSAIVTWKTTSSSTSTLKYGKTNSYGKEISDTSGSAVTTHTVKLSGLDHSSTYHFKIFGTDTDGNVMQSDDYNFDTLTFPKITDVNFQQVKGTATSTLKVTWDSNVPVSSTVRYTDPTGKTLEASQSQLVSKHEMIIAGLKDNTEYSMSVSGRDAYGNEGSSGIEKVKTDFDTRPPNISEITTETSMNGYGTNAKSQMIVSWYTDEPATSQVEYSKGVAGDSFTMATKEDAMLTTSHVVVVSDLDPSSSYYFRVISKDNSKNEAKSEANSALTEQARSSIFDIVLKSFESTLGWLFGGGK